jgi:hypothetical protein
MRDGKQIVRRIGLYGLAGVLAFVSMFLALWLDSRAYAATLPEIFIYIFSEGGLKFKGLKENKNVCFAIFEPYSGYENLQSLQIMGNAEIVEPFSDEYMRLFHHRRIPEEAIRKLPEPMNLIKIIPESCLTILMRSYQSQ